MSENHSHRSPIGLESSVLGSLVPIHGLPFKGLHYFQVAANVGSFEQAANQLHVTRGAVSQQIKSLEQWLGKPLFIRQGNQLTLTPAGEQLLPYVTEGLGKIQQGIAALNNTQTLLISSSHSFATFWLAKRSEDFRQRHPDIHWQMQPSNQILNTSQFQCDVAIRLSLPEQNPLPPRWQSREWFANQLVLVGSPEFCAKHDVLNNLSPEQCLSLPLLLDSSADLQPALAALYHYLNIAPGTMPVALNTTDAVPLVYGALNGQGIALVAHCLVEHFLRSGELQRITNFAFQDGQRFHVVAPDHHFNQDKVLRFLEWLFNSE